MAFRAVLKQNKNAPLSEEEKIMTQKIQEMDDRVQCKFCGRKFEENVAKRHITFCESKSKQIPKNPMKKRK